MIECFLADRRSEDEININKNIIPLEFRIDRSHPAPISHISAKKTKYLMKKKVSSFFEGKDELFSRWVFAIYYCLYQNQWKSGIIARATAGLPLALGIR